VEALDVTAAFWAGKRVLLTGHTGFKGGWLSLWLAELGADVHGFALQPPTTPSLFETARVASRLASSKIGDIRDSAAIAAAVRAVDPEIVLHLAAQPLVRMSYQDPIGTYATNVMGTVNLLEALRGENRVRAVVAVTTDKCYENDGRSQPYRESDPMGGHDPYSSSKGCAELVTAAYRRSFLHERGRRVATARAGNVIGGGDWSADRLVPDFLRAIDARAELVIRSPNATRPWQHVLEPLSGYLMLAQRLYEGDESLDGGWNFGPPVEDAKPVRWIVQRLCDSMPGSSWRIDPGEQPHEAQVLSLDSTKARTQLGWSPTWNVDRAIDRTIAWHRAWRARCDMQAVCVDHIREHEAAA
jgi:CDP-glucose 4,6-dehydratase